MKAAIYKEASSILDDSELFNMFLLHFVPFVLHDGKLALEIKIHNKSCKNPRQIISGESLLSAIDKNSNFWVGYFWGTDSTAKAVEIFKNKLTQLGYKVTVKCECSKYQECISDSDRSFFNDRLSQDR